VKQKATLKMFKQIKEQQKTRFKD